MQTLFVYSCRSVYTRSFGEIKKPSWSEYSSCIIVGHNSLCDSHMIESTLHHALISVGLETLQCSFVDSSGCQHFYFVADGRQIEAEKTQGKYRFIGLKYYAYNYRNLMVYCHHFFFLFSVCGGVSLAIPIWSIATIIVGGLLLVGLLVLIIIKIILLWLVRDHSSNFFLATLSGHACTSKLFGSLCH